MSTNLLEKLLNRGDLVFVENGKLIINAISSKPIPHNWIQENEPKLMISIAELIEKNIYKYLSYSSGCYADAKFPGVTLQFDCLLGNTEPHAIFNATITKQRHSRRTNAGTKYKNNGFRVGERSGFLKFWHRMGLPKPQSLTRFPMTKLKNIYVTADFVAGKTKFKNDSIEPLNISYQQLFRAHNLNSKPAEHLQNIDTNNSHKNLPPTSEEKGIEAYLTAGQTNCDISYQGDTDTSGVDNWLIEYDPNNELDDTKF